MNEPMPNQEKINRIVQNLARVRAAGAEGLPIGWGAEDIPPPDANHMEAMGAAEVIGERKLGRGVPGKSRVRAK